MNNIPPKLKKDLLNDPKYQFCALYRQKDENGKMHICGGGITWEHAIIYAGKQIQEKWAIISLCERGHAVNRFQDAGTMNKDMNVWVALNQATEDELRAYPKALPPLFFTRDRLNHKFGPYKPKFDVKKALLFNSLNY